MPRPKTRKDFTPSKRLAIGKALEARLGERRGGTNPQNFGELRGRESAEVAAEKAGFGNPETYRQAKAVTKRGTAELVKAMDAGDLSVSAAAKVTKENPAEQRRIISLPKALRQQAIKCIAPSPKISTEGT